MPKNEIYLFDSLLDCSCSVELRYMYILITVHTLKVLCVCVCVFEPVCVVAAFISLLQYMCFCYQRNSCQFVEQISSSRVLFI